MTELPKSTRVAAFDIEFTEWTSHEGNDRRAYGQFSSTQQTISVDTSVKPQKLLDTTLHEINHAIYWAYGLEDEDKEERIVATFATAWAQIYRDNPELLKWIATTVKRAND